MSVPEYHQKAEDHQSILLLIKFLNLETADLAEGVDEQSNSAKFDDLFDSINKELINVNVTKINGNLSYERTIRLRFKRNQYELSNNEWGDFQAHRKLCGLITVGILDEEQLNDDSSKVEELYEKHKKFADTYSTLLDSRCLLIKVKSTSSPTQSNDNCIGKLMMKSIIHQNKQKANLEIRFH